MDAASFLFPRDLELTSTKLSRVLLVGSCMSDIYRSEFSRLAPEVIFDYIVFNNAADLPDALPSSVQAYDFQYVQIPLRSVLTDAVVQAKRFLDPEFSAAILAQGRRNIDAMLEATLKHNRESGLLTFVSGFFVPQSSLA